MKVTYNDLNEFLEIELTPETMEEVSILARFANNAKADKPHVFMSFARHNVAPALYVSLSKVKTSVQCNSIKPDHQKK